MKICIATERMRLGFGVDLVVHEQARRLVDLGFDVTVVVLHADLEAQWRPYRLIVLNRFMRLEDAGSAATLDSVRHRFGLNDIDLWILHTPPFYDWAGMLDTPVILIEYGSPGGHFFAPHIGKILDAVVDRRLNDLYSKLLPCDAIVSISKDLHEWLPRSVRPMSTVSYLGCEHYGTANPEAAEQLRASLDINTDDCMILWVGRIQLAGDEQPYKGLAELLALIDLTSPHLTAAKFVFAGRVSDADRYNLQRRGIRVLANLTSDQMAIAFAAADMLINLSKWEGFNLALLEAQYQGTPVLAYDIGPHREVVSKDVTGLLVDSPKELFTALLELATDRPRREAMGREARIFAQDFNWDANVRHLVSVIETCMSKGFDRPTITAQRAEAAKRSTRSITTMREHRTSNARSLPEAKKVSARKVLVGRWSHIFPALGAGRFRTMARQAARGNDWEAASAWYLQLVTSGRATPRDRVQLGHALKEAGRSDSALEAYRQAAETSPLHLDAQRHYGYFLRSTGQDGQARDVLARALALDPFAEDISTELARMGVKDNVLLDEHILRGTLAGATSRGMAPPRLMPRILASRCLRDARRSARRRDWPSAEHHYRNVLQRDPANIGALVQLGHMVLEQGQAERALQQYRRALVFDPRNPSVYIHVGHALKAAGRRDSALAAYLTAWRLNPGIPGVLQEIRGLRPDLDAEWLSKYAAGVGDLPGGLPTAQQQPDMLLRAACRMLTGRSPTDAEVEQYVVALLRGDASSVRYDDVQVSQRTALQGRELPLSPEGAVAAGPDSEYFLAKAAGTIISPVEEQAILQLAAKAQSDLLIGDTLVIGDTGPDVLVAGRDFDHYTFRNHPSLGAAIGVRRDLADSLGSARQDLLTGALLIRLLSGAHTISYAPFRFGAIRKQDLDAAMPDQRELDSYAASNMAIAEKALGTFGTRSAPSRKIGRIAIIVVDEGQVDTRLRNEMLELIRERSSSTPIKLVLATNREPPAALSEITDVDLHLFTKDASFGEIANGAAKACNECDILIFMDAGIAPTQSQWLDRLVTLVERPDVGAVAPTAVYEDGRVRHAGMSWHADGPKYIDRFTPTDTCSAGTPDHVAPASIQTVPIVSRHCIAVRRKLFTDLGGFADLSSQSVDIEFSRRLELFDLARLIDRHTTVCAPDATPRWKRDIPAAESKALTDLYSDMPNGDVGNFFELGVACNDHWSTSTLLPLPYR